MVYWKLNYKKKFIWNLLQIPVVIALIILLSNNLSLFLSIVFITALIAVSIITLFYTYYKWKKEKQIDT
ncbi:hypothetical protein ABET41_10980 [Metabacillus fastidiosus]|uniref:hypothetical protein n=1 Tax=Metabacillus fastidiosus TaxID=1458 RepID=UPI003D28C7BD